MFMEVQKEVKTWVDWKYMLETWNMSQ